MTPQELALQPDTPFDQLEKLARLYADEVLQNPIFQNPKKQHGKWTELYNTARKLRAIQAMAASIELAEPPILRRWVCQCIEPALYLYEKVFQGDYRPRRALQIARRFAEGKAIEFELLRANHQALDAEQEAQEFYYSLPMEPDYKLPRRYLYVKECEVSGAYLVARAVHFATQPDEEFSKKAPHSTQIKEGPLNIAFSLSYMSLFEETGYRRVLHEETNELREQRQRLLVEEFALALAEKIDAFGDPERVLRELSLYRREEIHELHQKERQARQRQRVLQQIREGGDPELYRYLLPNPKEVLPCDRALDPTTPPEELLELAPEYARYVAQNPALIAIERREPAFGKQLREVIAREADFEQMQSIAKSLSRLQLIFWAATCAMKSLMEHLQSYWSERPIRLLLVAVGCTAGRSHKQKLRVKMALTMATLKRLEARPKTNARLINAFKAALEAAQVVLDGSYQTALKSARFAAEASKSPICTRKFQQQKLKQKSLESSHVSNEYITH